MATYEWPWTVDGVLSIDLAAVGNSDNENGHRLMLDFANGAIVANPVAPECA